MSRELEAEPTDGSAKVGNCVSISGFDVCMGKTYSFLINGRQIIGTVDDVGISNRVLKGSSGYAPMRKNSYFMHL